MAPIIPATPPPHQHLFNNTLGTYYHTRHLMLPHVRLRHQPTLLMQGRFGLGLFHQALAV